MILMISPLYLLFAVIIDIFEIEGMDVTREISQDRQGDVDEKVGAAPRYAVHSDGRDYANVSDLFRLEAKSGVDLLKIVIMTKRIAEIIFAVLLAMSQGVSVAVLLCLISLAQSRE